MLSPNRSHHLTARGNLTYLDFIRLVESIWKKAHPRIPLIATGSETDARYPCLVYSLENRTPFANESKPKIREVIRRETDEPSLFIYAQRFNNDIKFSAVDKISADGTQTVEELIEVFEDFMMEYTPVFKELGLSDFFYARRMSDSEETRSGEDIVKRAVVYRVITEKIIHSEMQKLESVLISARTFLEFDLATPSMESIDIEEPYSG